MNNFGNKKWIFRGVIYVASASMATVALPTAMKYLEPPIKIEARALSGGSQPTTYVAESPADFQEDTEEAPQSAVVASLESEPVALASEPIPLQEEVPVEEEILVEDEATTALPKRNWEQSEIDALIEQGLFSRQDYEYLLSVAGECNTSYEGFHAVASCVMNRIALNPDYSTVKQVVTAEGQFTAHNPIGSSTYNKLINQNVIDATVNVLLGDASSVGDSYYFYCKINDYELWVASECTEFYLVAGNLFVNKENYKYLHNMTTNRQEDDILVCSVLGEWQFESGTHYVK